jgi:hypothetical protein
MPADGFRERAVTQKRAALKKGKSEPPARKQSESCPAMLSRIYMSMSVTSVTLTLLASLLIIGCASIEQRSAVRESGIKSKV